jgi:hypothetical protein
MTTTRSITTRSITASVALLLGTGLLAACGATGGTGSSGAAGATGSGTSAPTRTVTVTVTVTPPVSPVTPAENRPIPGNSQAYAQDFVTAWVRRDGARADQLAVQAAVRTAFAHRLADAPSLQRCEGAAGSSYCTFNGPGYSVIVRVLNDLASRSQPHAVIEVRYSKA